MSRISGAPVFKMLQQSLLRTSSHWVAHTYKLDASHRAQEVLPCATKCIQHIQHRDLVQSWPAWSAYLWRPWICERYEDVLEVEGLAKKCVVSLCCMQILILSYRSKPGKSLGACAGLTELACTCWPWKPNFPCRPRTGKSYFCKCGKCDLK